MSDLNIELTIKDLRKESQDCFSILFERPRTFDYKAGQSMDIRFPTSEFPLGTSFSFASSPTETDLQITFKKGLSKLKKRMEKVTRGEKMLITVYGGKFELDKSLPAVFIAGGVGITPFRSMIQEVIDKKEKVEIILIYLNHTEDFPFKDLLTFWQETYPLLKIHYLVTGREGRLTKEKLDNLLQAIDFKNDKFYIAGPPGMVKNTENILLESKVNRNKIETESFDGYE